MVSVGRIEHVTGTGEETESIEAILMVGHGLEAIFRTCEISLNSTQSEYLGQYERQSDETWQSVGWDGSGEVGSVRL